MSDPADIARRRVPAPRRKLTVSLTAPQAGKLRVLWQEHSGPLHALLVGWCRDVQNASDILQETFRRLAASPAIMDKMDNPRAFLAVSARRIAVDFARRSNTRTAYQTAAGAEMPAVENPGPTDETLRTAITEALASLPPEQRLVVEHKMMKGRTLDDIAKLENISLNTAASRLRYALDKIRSHLRPYYDDLNRKEFKIMKNDLPNDEQAASQRIITPLQPKRVPSVAPGLEGLAAMAPDACEAAPEIMALEPEFLVAAGETPTGELPEPAIAFCGVGGNAWEGNLPEAVELPAIDSESMPSDGSGEFTGISEWPEFVSCEVLPSDGEVPNDWLERPENFFVTLFEGEDETGVVGAGDGESADGEGVPFDFESGFEICVLPVPEEFTSVVDSNELLARYEAFLSDNPDWGAPDPDVMEAQVVTPSSNFAELEFGTPSKAAAFDSWYVGHYQGLAFSTADPWSNDGTDDYGSAPDDSSWSFDPKELLPRYEAFLSENPDWNASDPDLMETQVVTPSSYFAELEFGTPSKAAAFDSWYEANYAQSDADGGGLLGGSSFVLAPGNFPWGTVLSGGEVHSEGNPSFETTGVIMDVRNGLTGVPAEWMRGGASGGGGLMLNGGVPDPVAGGGSVSLNGVPDFEGTTVVTGGQVDLADGVTVDKTDGNVLTLSNGATVVLEGGEVVSGETVYAYDPEVGADVSARIELGELPTEITLAEASGVEVAPSFTNAAAGLAPTPGAALIVEFSVLSPSEAVQPATGSPIVADQSASQDVDNLPHEFSAATSHDAIEASAISTSNIDTSHDLSPQVAASGHESAAAAPSSQKVDAPTVAAGAVAAGTVVHGGAAAPSVRRPLPKV